MDIHELTAPCGVDCFNCAAYEDNITDRVRQHLASLSGKDPGEVACKGCRNAQGKDLPLVSECKTYKCCIRNEVAFCYECTRFPCRKLAPCLSKADLTPHNMKIYNLLMIKAVGIEKWAEEVKTIRELYTKGEYVPGIGPVLKK